MSNRAQPRLDTRVRVLSQGLPGSSAITVDLSQTGLQLETEQRMEVGTELLLQLEFERENLRDFSCSARVIWSKPDRTGNRFRTGLAFLPTDDAQSIALARTATVLQTRSESDLEILLDVAREIAPERAETFARVRAQSRAEQGGSGGIGPGRRVLPLLGVYIPLRIVIDGYRWDRKKGLLTVNFLDSTREHKLYFPSCRVLTDYGCGDQPTVTALFCTPHSEAIKRMPPPRIPDGWKHYRFLQADRQPVLELVSAPCTDTMP